MELDRLPGDRIILYTDGITETLSPRRETFGLERLKAVIDNSEDDPETLVANIVRAVDRHRDTSPARDDQTLLAIQVCNMQDDTKYS